MKSKYKKYKALLTNCLKVAEQSYYCQLFDDTKQSAYNLCRNLGPLTNPNKKKSRERSIKCVLRVSNDQDIVNPMTMYFCGIGEKL